jgi:hypothetical protein
MPRNAGPACSGIVDRHPRITHYQFKDEVHCGLPCNQPHLRGYLVVTETGEETNIGKDCGRSYFSVNFEEMRRQFDRDMARKERQDIIRRFKARLPQVRQDLKALKDGVANTLYKQSRPLVELNKGLPGRIVSALDNMIRSGTDDVVTERLASKPARGGPENALDLAQTLAPGLAGHLERFFAAMSGHRKALVDVLTRQRRPDRFPIQDAALGAVCQAVLAGDQAYTGKS